MHRVLLGLALGAAFATPASAGASAAGSFSASSASNVRVLVPRTGVRIHRDGARHFRNMHRGNRFGFDGYDYPGFYAADYEMNRSWDPDSFNDWWHDRPDRAFPRWVAHNENCTPDRMWWSGSGWHC
jgi:hypothetical protein